VIVFWVFLEASGLGGRVKTNQIMVFRGSYLGELLREEGKKRGR